MKNSYAQLADKLSKKLGEYEDILAGKPGSSVEPSEINAAKLKVPQIKQALQQLEESQKVEVNVKELTDQGVPKDEARQVVMQQMQEEQMQMQQQQQEMQMAMQQQQQQQQQAPQQGQGQEQQHPQQQEQQMPQQQMAYAQSGGNLPMYQWSEGGIPSTGKYNEAFYANQRNSTPGIDNYQSMYDANYSPSFQRNITKEQAAQNQLFSQPMAPRGPAPDVNAMRQQQINNSLGHANISQNTLNTQGMMYGNQLIKDDALFPSSQREYTTNTSGMVGPPTQEEMYPGLGESAGTNLGKGVDWKGIGKAAPAILGAGAALWGASQIGKNRKKPEYTNPYAGMWAAQSQAKTPNKGPGMDIPTAQSLGFTQSYPSLYAQKGGNLPMYQRGANSIYDPNRFQNIELERTPIGFGATPYNFGESYGQMALNPNTKIDLGETITEEEFTTNTSTPEDPTGRDRQGNPAFSALGLAPTVGNLVMGQMPKDYYPGFRNPYTGELQRSLGQAEDLLGEAREDIDTPRFYNPRPELVAAKGRRNTGMQNASDASGGAARFALQNAANARLAKETDQILTKTQNTNAQWNDPRQKAQQLTGLASAYGNIGKTRFGIGAGEMAEHAKKWDLDARTDATSRAFTGAGLSQLGQWAQIQQQMGNQQEMDELRTMQLSEMLSNYEWAGDKWVPKKTA